MVVNKSFSYLDGSSSNSSDLVEHHCKVCLVWYLLYEKSRQEMLLCPMKSTYLTCDICLAILINGSLLLSKLLVLVCNNGVYFYQGVSDGLFRDFKFCFNDFHRGDVCSGSSTCCNNKIVAQHSIIYW